MSDTYPSFFLGDVPEVPEDVLDLDVSDVWEIAFEAGAKHAAEHLYNYHASQLIVNRGSGSRTYSDLKLRMDWLHNVFNGLSPNPTGE